MERRPVQLVLSIFPGLGLLDMAFELEGFCVVRGPDVLWGGDVRRFHPPAGKFDGIIGGPPCQAFSQLAHMVRHNGYEPKFGNLIPEYERVVAEAQPQWFIMENVPAAPVPGIAGYDVHAFILNNRQCLAANGEPATQNRARRISWGWRGEGRPPLLIDVTVFENTQFDYAACGGTSGESGISSEQYQDTPAAERARLRKRGVPVAIGGSGKVKPLRKNQRLNSHVGSNIKSRSSLARLCELQGLPSDFLKDSPLTVSGACKAVGNGVPLPMGRAIARAVIESIKKASAA